MVCPAFSNPQDYAPQWECEAHERVVLPVLLQLHGACVRQHGFDRRGQEAAPAAQTEVAPSEVSHQDTTRHSGVVLMCTCIATATASIISCG
jgi:hypothetical protein